MSTPPLDTKDHIEWYRKLVHAYEHVLTEEEKDALHEWERQHLDGTTVGTSDWPGWKKHIGLPPWKWKAN